MTCVRSVKKDESRIASVDDGAACSASVTLDGKADMFAKELEQRKRWEKTKELDGSVYRGFGERALGQYGEDGGLLEAGSDRLQTAAVLSGAIRGRSLRYDEATSSGLNNEVSRHSLS